MPLFSAFWGTTELCRVARPRSSFSLTPYNHLLVDRVGARKPVLANGLGEEMHIEKRSLPDQGWINHRGAPRPGLHKPIGRVSDDHGITRRDRKVQIVCAAEIVVVDGVEVAQRTIGKDGGDRCAGTGGASSPAGDQPHTPSPAGVVGSCQRAACHTASSGATQCAPRRTPGSRRCGGRYWIPNRASTAWRRPAA